jgi:hypothetical protein
MRTFCHFPLIYKPQAAPDSLFTLNTARMNQPSFDQIVELLVRNERSLSEFRQSISEVKQCLDALAHKVDLLVDQSIVRNQSGTCSPVVRSGLRNGLPILTPNACDRGLEPRSARQ